MPYDLIGIQLKNPPFYIFQLDIFRIAEQATFEIPFGSVNELVSLMINGTCWSKEVCPLKDN